jgi:hypothetical protein
VATDQPALRRNHLSGIRTSSACSGGTCVGVASIDDGVAIVDTKDDDGPALVFTTEEWAAFVSGVKNGEFDGE